MSENRQFLALRAYVDLLLQHGACILAREPLLIRYGERTLRYSCGMLLCDDDIEVVELA